MFARPRTESAPAPVDGMLGRDPTGRALFESACQQLHTRMTEGGLHNVAFMHDGVEGNARYNPRTEPVISVRHGSMPQSVAISSLAQLSYQGKPLARLQSDELQAATRLVNSIMASAGSVSRL